MFRVSCVMGLLLSLASFGFAAEPAHGGGVEAQHGTTPAAQDPHAAGEKHEAHALDAQPHPAVPADAGWVGGVVTLIVIMFLAALPAGLIDWMFRPNEPVVEDHDMASHSHEAHEHDKTGLDKQGGHDPHAGHGGPAHH